MARLYRAIYALSQAGAVLAALMLVGMVGHIMLEIILRGLFDTSTFVVDEFVGYAMIGAIFWSLGYTVEHGALIRVTVLTQRLPAWVERASLVLAAASTLVVTLWLMQFFWTRLARNYARGTVSSSIAAVPSWIPEAILFSGLVILALQLAAFGLRQITGHPSPATPTDDAFVE
ncbi:TRAP transporter small permease subunit [Falsirhodobacter sp. 1013]|uniref:TRAP transporter small permease subunit n=1 Tax=Falsirhodobacter sp. 1013 TaxID=3417566 RepID=UPI003EB7CCC8